MTLETPALPEPPAYRLYSARHVAVATFLGAPFAGAVLMYLNARRLGQRSTWAFLAAGLLFTVALLLVAFLLPEGFPSMGLPIASIVVMQQLATHLQGTAFEGFVAQGGRPASTWGAVGVGLASMVLVLGGLAAWVFLGPDSRGTLLELRPGERIYYSGVEEAEARKLEAFLRQEEIFDGSSEKDVVLSRSGQIVSVDFVAPGAVGNAEVEDYFRTMVQSLEKGPFAGRTVQIRLCDENLDVKKVLP